jgi:hypothetical protein
MPGGGEMLKFRIDRYIRGQHVDGQSTRSPTALYGYVILPQIYNPVKNYVDT